MCFTVQFSMYSFAVALASSLFILSQAFCFVNNFFYLFFCCFAFVLQLLYLITFVRICQQLFSSFFAPVTRKRRRRDLNPRAATNDLLPFQGSPFSHLGTSPKCLTNFAYQTERVGFEPTRPFGQTVFKTASL